MNAKCGCNCSAASKRSKDSTLTSILNSCRVHCIARPPAKNRTSLNLSKKLSRKPNRSLNFTMTRQSSKKYLKMRARTKNQKRLTRRQKHSKRKMMKQKSQN